jgi:membrane protein DedA with SNARE-associated domain
VGLTQARIDRICGIVERRGRPVIALGRATPGLRTLTVVAAGSSGLAWAAALLPLIIGSSVFLQFHVALGLIFGAAARGLVERHQKQVLIAVVVLAVIGLGVWLVTKGRRSGAQSFAEASCPACLGLGAIAARTGLELDKEHWHG